MIASISPEGYIVFNLNIDNPYDWIDIMNNCFPNTNYYVGCYGQYENCLIPCPL